MKNNYEQLSYFPSLSLEPLNSSSSSSRCVLLISRCQRFFLTILPAVFFSCWPPVFIFCESLNGCETCVFWSEDWHFMCVCTSVEAVSLILSRSYRLLFINSGANCFNLVSNLRIIDSYFKPHCFFLYLFSALIVLCKFVHHLFSHLRPKWESLGWTL